MGFEFRVSVWGVEGAEFKATAGALRLGAPEPAGSICGSGGDHNATLM